MKGKAAIPLVIGLVAGVFAIKYSMDAIKNAKGATNTDEVIVVVAAADIPATVTIKPEMLTLKKTPRTPLLPSDAFSKIENLVGRVSLKAIPQGSPVLPTMIAPEGTLPGLLTRVKNGYRAVAVKIDESSGVGYLVRPNDWVDVLVVMDVQRRTKYGNKTQTISRVILQRVQVGAVGQVLGYDHEEGAKQARTVTLLVKEDNVPKLHLAQTKGRLTLAMRGNEDVAINEPAEANQAEMLGEAAPEEEEPEKEEGPSMFETLVSAWMTAQAAIPEPQEVEPPRPFTVVVFNGNSSDPTGGVMQRITYRNERSMEVISISGNQADDPVLDAGIGTGQPGGPQAGFPQRATGPRTRSQWLRANGINPVSANTRDTAESPNGSAWTQDTE